MVKDKKKSVKDVKVEEIKDKKTTEDVVDIPVVDEKTVESKTKKEINISKSEKKKRFFSEVKSFLGIVLIISVFVGGGFLIRKYIKPLRDKHPEEETKIVEASDYKTVVYRAGEGRKIKLLNKKYVLEYLKNTLYKIMDMEGNIIFEGKEEYTNIYEGIDGEIYLIFTNDNKNSNSLSLFRIHDKKLEEVNIYEKEGVTYAPVLYKKDGYKKIIGVVGESVLTDEEEYTYKSIIYTLEKERYEVEKLRLIGDEEREMASSELITYSDNYIIAKEVGDSYKCGVFDLREGKLVIKTTYDGLYTTFDGNYIALKHGKAGIINLKLKKIVDYDYDFIDRNNGFYVVSKKNKLAIMDDNYKLITGFDFKYQNGDTKVYDYYLGKDEYNTFKAYKHNDKYVLTINNLELDKNINYDKHETYIINQDGEYSTLVVNEFKIKNNFIYAYDSNKKECYIYNDDFTSRFTIALSSYDYNTKPNILLVNHNTVVVHLDSDIYYDYELGTEMNEMKDASLKIENIEFKYTHKIGKVFLNINGKKEVEYDYDPFVQGGSFYKKLSETTYYYAYDNLYVMVKKSE